MPRRPPAAPSGHSDTPFELGALFEFSNIVNGTLDTGFMLGHFLLTIMGKLLSLRGMVLLEHGKGMYRVRQVRGLSTDLVGTDLSIPNVPGRFLYAGKENLRKLPWLTYFTGLGLEVIVPLEAQEKTVGLAAFSQRATGKKLSDKESKYVRSLANIAAAAVEKGLILDEVTQVNKRLDGKIQELNTLFELSKEFGAVLDRDKLLRLLMFSVMGHIGATRFVLCLDDNGRMEQAAARPDRPADPGLIRMLGAIPAPVAVSSLPRDGRRRTGLEEHGIQAVIPFHLQQKTIGVLALGDKLNGAAYTRADLDFLSSLGNLAIISLENARLFQDGIERQKLEDELAIARDIQRRLLPSKLPSIRSFELAAVNVSSKQVGGDYYDIIPLCPGGPGGDPLTTRYVIAVGDVSGKGTPASLLMANLQATIRALVPLELPLSELTRRVNDLICENTGLDRFITFFWGILDPVSHRLNYVSAGHNPPILLRSGGTIERLDKGGIILGIMKTAAPYEEGNVVVEPGDTLVLFTDGVSESMNAAGEEMGEDALERIVRENGEGSADEILAAIVEAVKVHSHNTPQYDDITLVILKALG